MPRSPRPFPGLLSGITILVIAFALQFSAGVALTVFHFDMDQLNLWVFSLLSLTTLGIAIAAATFWGKRINPDWSPWSKAHEAARANALTLALGLVLTTVGASVVLGEVSNLLMDWIPPSDEIVKLFDKILTTKDVGASLVALSIVAPITEELLFRGVLLPGFARRYGIAASIVMTSALFGLFHMNVWQAIPAFVVGLYLGWVRMSSKTIFPAIVAHAVFNASPVVSLAAGLSIPGYNSPLASGIVSIDAVPLICAGMVLVVGIVVSIAALWGRTSCPQDPISAKMPE